MKISYIKNTTKKLEKNKYLSHQKKENFLFQTIPSFVQSYRTHINQKNSTFLDSWITTPQFSNPNTLLEVSITWLGHASFLIRLANITILTDPVFGSLPLFARLTPHGIPIDLLPSIDAVLLSHNHPDHMDFSSLTHLAYRFRNIHFSIAHGDAQWFSHPLFKNINEHKWHDKTIIETKNDGIITCTFLPAYHWSRRGLFDINQSFWGSWLIEWHDHAIYFGGDSAYFEHFKEIGSMYKITTALLPIAPIQPYKWMSRSHMSPNDAGNAFFDLNAIHFIPMHWGTFQFGIDKHQDAVELLKKWQSEHQKKLNLENKTITILKIGQSITF